MPRRKPKHDDLVREIRQHVAKASMATSDRYSDDMDMYYVEKAGYSPMIRAVEIYAEHMKSAEDLAGKLLEIGADAADAVAKGLRTRGRWRELLLPYAKAHVDIPAIRATLELVARRTSDPLAEKVIAILPTE